MGLKLLHISDIHFKCFDKHQYLDLDKDIQSEVEFDLKDLKAKYGKIDIILIGGDIAFSGKEEEYKIADRWIKKICSITGCEEENVLTVPGNHDVDREKVSVMVKDVHQQFKKLRKRVDIDSKIWEYITNPESAKTLLSPLTNYNTFAQKYGSIPQSDNVLFWEKEFNIDNSILRIRGVNSAFVSDESDDENTSKLILGSTQSNFVRKEGVINVVLCHHPPQWLYDGEEAQIDFKSRVRLHLFGHKHSFSTELVNDCLILSAGAMQPSRRESGWEPRYNIIELTIPLITQNPTLNIKLFERVWDKEKRKFKADCVDGDRLFEEFNLNLNSHEVTETKVPNKEELKELIITPMAEPVIDINAPDPKRKLAYIFLGLPYHVKLKIAVELGLIDDTDRDLEEVQKAKAYFKRASDKNLLHDLWEKVAKASGITSHNPFTK
ncbi:metallophosphoesterase [Pedobacter sp. L105]|uniref:metallophosphoesterase n=1 Tax=Pedobacter sp. L105 TaxID=1641871 RepID=UPI00131C2A3A|nr:metallophosphoesterase [Pedobacter sp. L105]